MGGVSANRLTNQSGGLNGDSLGATGGAETHTLSTAQIPSHTHSQYTDRVQEGFDNGVSYAGYSPSAGNHAPTTWNIGSTGGGGAHNNVQPTFILTYIIKT